MLERVLFFDGEKKTNGFAALGEAGQRFIRYVADYKRYPWNVDWSFVMLQKDCREERGFILFVYYNCLW